MTDNVRIPIAGMTCHTCVVRITRALRGVDGVEWVKVGLEPDEARVRFDPTRSSLGALGSAIVLAGYEPALDRVTPLLEQPSVGLLTRLGLRR